MHRLLIPVFMSMALACGEDTAQPEPTSSDTESSALRSEWVCDRTACEQDRAEAMARCLSACHVSRSKDCKTKCSQKECDPNESSECTLGHMDFVLESEPNEELRDACDRAVSRDERCGETNVLAHCNHLSRVETSDARRNYNCISETPCGAPLTGCEPRPTSTGTELCEVHDRLCGLTAGVCDTHASLEMNEAYAWLRADVIDSLRVCLGATDCESLWQCVDSWEVAVYPWRKGS